MGGSSYSVANATTSRLVSGAATNTVSENFKQRKVHVEMKSVDITLREARDSEAHPQSLAVILGLDVTGSMGSIPQRLCRDGLPKIMGKLTQSGVSDPAILFLGIGDHECDTQPLQVGQFESGDEELDHWLNNTWLEGGGGGNYGESYLLAYYFAAFHTAIDCWEKRNRKGLLITIGDEPPLKDLPAVAVKTIMPDTPQSGSYTIEELLRHAQETYEVHHIHLNHHGGIMGDRYGTGDWEKLLGDHLHIIQSDEQVPQAVIDIVSNHAEAVPAAVTAVPDTHKVEEVL